MVLPTTKKAYTKPYFHLLHEDKEEIEKEFGEELLWIENPDKKTSRIILRLNNADPTNRSQWEKQHIWLAEKLEIFHKVFVDRVKNLNPDGWQPDEEMD
jgi:hypothetical protein